MSKEKKIRKEKKKGSERILNYAYGSKCNYLYRKVTNLEADKVKNFLKVIFYNMALWSSKKGVKPND